MKFLLLFLFISKITGYPSSIPIQTFTTPSDREQGVLAALNFTINRINSAIHTSFSISHKNKVLREALGDTWGVMKQICDRLEDGFVMMLAGESSKTHEAYRTIANSFKIPLINWDFPSSSLSNNFVDNFEVSVKPSNAELIADIIVLKNWENFIYIHDNQNTGALNLELIYRHLRTKTNRSITNELIQLPREVSDFPNFFDVFNENRYPKNQSHRIILDTENGYRQQEVLKAIRLAQFNQSNYHYVVANFDFQPHNVEMFQDQNINITGFQILNRELREFVLLEEGFKQSKFSYMFFLFQAHLAFVHDAVLVAYHTLDLLLKKNDSLFDRNFRNGEFYNRGIPGFYCNLSYDNRNPDRQFEAFEHGNAIAKVMKNIKLSAADGALTGIIEFDRTGARKSYDVNVIDILSKSSVSKKEISVWKQGEGFITNRSVPQYTKPLDNFSTRKKVRVVTVLVEPFVMIKKECEYFVDVKCQGNDRFEGYCIDLLKLLSEKIKDFDYEIVLSKGNKYGIKQPDGSWDGMIGYLLRGEADVAHRERVVDFSKPFMTTGISIMIKKPDKKEYSIFWFMNPLDNELWKYIIFSYISVSVIFFLVSRLSPYEWRVEKRTNGELIISNNFSICNCLWFTLAAFMRQRTDMLPRSFSGRIASTVWWLFTFLIICFYIADLIIFWTVEPRPNIIENVEDLVKQTEIKYGIQQGGLTANFFEYSSIPLYQKMWEVMKSQNPSVFTSSYAEGIYRVRNGKGQYAFLLESTANEYVNTRKPCDTMKVGENLNSVGYGVATPFGSQWKHHINLAILALEEIGKLKRLKTKWWYDRGQCSQGVYVEYSAGLNVSKTIGLFYILIGGMILSIFIALAEFMYQLIMEVRKGQINSTKDLKESLYRQLKLFLRGEAVVKEGTPAYEVLKTQKASSLLSGHNDLNPSSAILTNDNTTHKRRDKNNSSLKSLQSSKDQNELIPFLDTKGIEPERQLKKLNET